MTEEQKNREDLIYREALKLAAQFKLSELRDKIDEENAKATPDFILEKVAFHYNKSVEDILGRSRLQEIILPRFVAMQLIREFTGLTYKSIGMMFRRDHSTVLNAINSFYGFMLDETHKSHYDRLYNNLVPYFPVVETPKHLLND